MNASSIKTVLVLAVLGAVGYGVYVKLNNSPDNSTPPPKGADGWSAQPPKIELSGVGTGAPTFPDGRGGMAAAPGPNAGRAFALNIPGPGPSGPTDSSANAGGAAPLSSYPGRAEVSSAPAGAPANGRPPADPFPAGGPGPWSNPTPPSPVVAISPPSSAPASDYSLSSGAAASPAASDRPNEDVRKAFAALMEAAMVKLGKGELAEVHLTLSEWYGDPRLPSDQARQLAELLSQLAGTVIYSQQSFLERPYVLRFGDSLESIAQVYHVPPQMLANINNIRNPNDLQPGQELKVVRGPFNAILDLSRHELVLMLDGRYAGRFAIGVGRDCPPLERQYVVRDKRIIPASPDATQTASQSQGNRWIDLGGGLGIHATDAPQNIGRNEGQGAILMSERDLAELYDILTVGTNGSNGSTVIVRR